MCSEIFKAASGWGDLIEYSAEGNKYISLLVTGHRSGRRSREGLLVPEGAAGR